jgi:hypothetical protein
MMKKIGDFIKKKIGIEKPQRFTYEFDLETMKSTPLTYFVSYAYFDQKGVTGVGRANHTTRNGTMSKSELTKIEEEIKDKGNYKNVVVTNFIIIRGN